MLSCTVMSDSATPWTVQPIRLLYPWGFSGKNTRVGCHLLLQGIFLTQGSNLHLLHSRWILYHWTIREASEKVLYKLWRCVLTKENTQDYVALIQSPLTRLGHSHPWGSKSHGCSVSELGPGPRSVCPEDSDRPALSCNFRANWHLRTAHTAQTWAHESTKGETLRKENGICNELPD